jgi:hypothetical protein
MLIVFILDEVFNFLLANTDDLQISPFRNEFCSIFLGKSLFRESNVYKLTTLVDFCKLKQ